MSYLVSSLPDQDYPPQLREIPEPPKQLFIAGMLPPPETVILTVVGSRKHTSYGKDACSTLVAGLRGYPISICSGLALGIDTIAHRAALDAGLHTIAVPGSGLAPATIYPRTNQRLAEEIVDRGGCLLSEYAPDFPAAPWTFPQRNRVMAGLAKATLVIESEMKSGTRITARLATEYNRDVFAVPGSIFSAMSRGTNALIALGATPIATPEDLILALGFELPSPAGTQETFDLTLFSPGEQTLLQSLTEPRTKDELFRLAGVHPSEGNVLLMRLEIAGAVTDAGAGRIRRAWHSDLSPPHPYLHK